MGSCVSTVLPRCVRSPKGRTPLSDDSDSRELPGEVNGKELPDSVNSKSLPDDVHSKLVPNGIHRKHLPDDVHDKTKVVKTKRRALLVGITYTSPSNTWSQLDGPHGDVDQYRDLLINTYGYRPEDIVVLKDLPEFPEQSKPTQVNMIRELKALVSGAEQGDKFTFFYSGHSDQQDATTDLEEEDGMDEMIITSDEKTIIDNELKEILVNPLPVGCTLLAILDTCHSGTMLDLPHYHCNSIYVPWQSKGERRTMTMQNINGDGLHPPRNRITTTNG
ncbi:caspase domain-containing protein [Russula emetica]|nr:caspase domain-containing protein [Russula emetica]